MSDQASVRGAAEQVESRYDRPDILITTQASCRRSGPNRPGRGAHIATASFVVARTARRLGVGRELGAEAIRWAQQERYAGMQFNAVVETNRAAVHLWRSLGFRIMATIPGAFDSLSHGRVGLHVMFRRI